MTSPLTSSADLLLRLQTGDERAAAAIFERYTERLTKLAKSRLSARLAARTDPEDIVLSAYRSFFVGARDARFTALRGGDLWRLLVEVTLHKLYRQAAHHQAQRRSVRRETAPSGSYDPLVLAEGREPTPEEAVVAADELERLLAALDKRGREVVELRLQGYTQEEIAERLGCTARTVRKWLAAARRSLVGEPPDSADKAESDIPSPNLPWSDFILRQQIGAGATGKVYRAWHVSQQREVAVKFLRKSLLRHGAAVARFLREARTVAELAHPGIVAVHGAGRTPGGGHFLLMDLIEGRNLHQVQQADALSPQTAAAWIAQAARTLHFAHERGVIHCDLKPSNLLLAVDGRILVTDFGLATRLAEDDEADRGRLAGTPAFMAPEQVDPRWGPVSARTDVWGLGAVLYFLLFGRPPHAGQDVAEVLARVASDRAVEIPPKGMEDVPPAVIEVLRCCLARPQHLRFATAAELAEALVALH